MEICVVLSYSNTEVIAAHKRTRYSVTDFGTFGAPINGGFGGIRNGKGTAYSASVGNYRGVTDATGSRLVYFSSKSGNRYSQEHRSCNDY